MEYLPALRDDSLQEGTMSAAELNGHHVLLARIGGEVFAVDGTCTHEDADLANGFLVEDRVVCALHLSEFELRTGRVLNPPATVPLKTFKIKIEDGTIFVEV